MTRKNRFKRAVEKFRAITPDTVREWVASQPDRPYFGSTHPKDMPEWHNPMANFVRDTVGVRVAYVGRDGHTEIGNEVSISGMVEIKNTPQWWGGVVSRGIPLWPGCPFRRGSD